MKVQFQRLICFKLGGQQSQDRQLLEKSVQLVILSQKVIMSFLFLIMIHNGGNMGRQTQIIATANDISLLVETVKKEFPELYRLDYKADIVNLPYDVLIKTGMYYITTKEVYHQTISLIEQKKKSGLPYWEIADVQNQCVEIGASIWIDKDIKLISGRLPGARIYVNSERCKTIDKLYSCFVRHTKRMTIKYKSNSPYDRYLYHCFPEAQKIISDYLNRENENASYQGYKYNFLFVDGFPEGYSFK